MILINPTSVARRLPPATHMNTAITTDAQGVILPIMGIRRLECVLLAWRNAKREEVVTKRPKLIEADVRRAGGGSSAFASLISANQT